MNYEQTKIVFMFVFISVFTVLVFHNISMALAWLGGGFVSAMIMALFFLDVAHKAQE